MEKVRICEERVTRVMVLRMQLQKATLADIELFAAVRNDELSIRFSKRGKLTAAQIEQDYFGNPKKSSFVAHANEERVGICVFENLGSMQYEISVGLHPDFRGAGLGSELVHSGTEYCCAELSAQKIIAYINAENKASLKAFVGAGYELVEPGEPLARYEWAP